MNNKQQIDHSLSVVASAVEHSHGELGLVGQSSWHIAGLKKRLTRSH